MLQVRVVQTEHDSRRRYRFDSLRSSSSSAVASFLGLPLSAIIRRYPQFDKFAWSANIRRYPPVSAGGPVENPGPGPWFLLGFRPLPFEVRLRASQSVQTGEAPFLGGEGGSGKWDCLPCAHATTKWAKFGW